jgi:hypothetical protein
VPTAKLIAATLAISLGWSAKAVADDAAADREAALLHRRIDLSGVKQWNRLSGSWQSLRVTPAAVYVVNLWSVQCRPCIAEFPLLKNVLAGWKAKPEVQFYFIADPPGETSEIEATTFWQKSLAALPDADPCRAETEDLRRKLEDGAEPITLLLDDHFIVRQAFIGGIGNRPLGRSIERLLRASKEGSETGRHRHRAEVSTWY